MKDFILISEISKVFNSEGFLSLVPYTDFPERFLDLEFVLIDVFGDYRKFIIEEAYFHNKFPVVKFVNFNNANEVQFLIGRKMYVALDNSVKLSNNMFFIHDLIGIDVFKQSEFLGTIVDVLKLPANDVYVVEGTNNNELLVPAVKDYVERIDEKERKLYLTEIFEIDETNEN